MLDVDYCSKRLYDNVLIYEGNEVFLLIQTVIPIPLNSRFPNVPSIILNHVSIIK